MEESKKLMLICGATGFIGRNLLEFFSKKGTYRIRATHFSRNPPTEFSNVEWVKCDLRDRESVKSVMKDVNVVLQFAATTSGAKDIVSKPFIHVTDNAIMNSLLLREAFEHGVEHFVFPSCTIMYQKSDSAISETDFNPSDEILPFYFGAGHTKVYLERMCEFYAGLGKTKHTVIRHSNLYGSYDKFDLEKSHVFGATVTKVMTSTDGEVKVWGTGEEARDLLHVEDFLNFVDIAIEKQASKYELVNVGLGEGIKIKDLVRKIVDASGRNLQIVHDLSKPTVPTSLYLNCNKAKEIFGWEPSVGLEEGIQKTLSWYEKHISL